MSLFANLSTERTVGLPPGPARDIHGRCTAFPQSAAGDFELVELHLRTLGLARTFVVATAGDELSDAYFPHSGIISLVVRLIEGEMTEVAMVGRDSVFGASTALTGSAALSTVIVRSPGACSVLSVERLNTAVDQSKTFRSTLLRDEQAIFVQARQAAACVATHPAVARLAQGLLCARDAAGSHQLRLSQESLCQMLGVKRNVVSVVAGTLLLIWLPFHFLAAAARNKAARMAMS
jgi:CRP-like cAMP-binding protein